VSAARTVLTVAALTLREASRRRVLLALAVLTLVLLALSGWGFSRLAAESGGSALTSSEARLTASIVLNLVMFGYSLIAALGTAFLAGPTVSGETGSGIVLAVLARPIRRSSFLLGKWLGACLAWDALWVAMVWGLAAPSFLRKDL
jgi:ABC-type transport system involved in multi-copper enzyme maturation permease subunit